MKKSELTKKGYITVTSENYGKIRHNLINPKVQVLLPTVKELKGVDENTKLRYLATVEEYVNSKARVKQTTAYEHALSGLLNKANRSKLSTSERVTLASGLLFSRSFGYGEALDFARQAQGIWGKDWYEVKYYVEEGALNVNRASNQQLWDILDASAKGEIDLTEDELKSIQDKLEGTGHEYQGYGQEEVRVTDHFLKKAENAGVFARIEGEEDLW